MTRAAHLFLAPIFLCMSNPVPAAADRISERNSAMARTGAITMASGIGHSGGELIRSSRFRNIGFNK